MQASFPDVGRTVDLRIITRKPMPVRTSFEHLILPYPDLSAYTYIHPVFNQSGELNRHLVDLTFKLASGNNPGIPPGYGPVVERRVLRHIRRNFDVIDVIWEPRHVRRPVHAGIAAIREGCRLRPGRHTDILFLTRISR